MNNNTVKITVTDIRGDLVLATTSETYAADLQNNKDKLNVCGVAMWNTITARLVMTTPAIVMEKNRERLYL